MDILVINEPFTKYFCRTQRWAARTRGRVLRAPDWLAYATAVLEQGYKGRVRLYDFPALNWGRDDYIALIKKECPKWIVLDSTTPSIFSDLGYAKIAKEIVPKCKIILVGPHASALPEETLKNANGAVDYIVIGEYDFAVKEIIDNAEAPAKIPGIAYLENGIPRRTSHRKLIDDLDSLPFPSWDHLNLKDYFDGGKLHPYIDIISGRGCPNGCIFCLWPQVMHGYKHRLRSAKNVVDEIERDIKLCPEVLKTGEFFFEDDTFTVNTDRAIEICNEITKRKLKIRFSVNARVDTANNEMFARMKNAGCRELLVGFESGDDQMLKNMNKGTTTEQARSFVKLAKKHGFDVHGCFVIGLPGETKQTAEKTIKFALGLGLHTAQFSGAVPFPGTSYFNYCEKEGLLRTKNWEEWLQSGEQKGVIDYPHFSAKEIDALVDEGLKRFYFRLSYLLRFALETKSLSDLYRKTRGALNFFSYLFEKAVGGKVASKKYASKG